MADPWSRPRKYDSDNRSSSARNPSMALQVSKLKLWAQTYRYRHGSTRSSPTPKVSLPFVVDELIQYEYDFRNILEKPIRRSSPRVRRNNLSDVADVKPLYTA